jgi:hypothetical protein
LGRDHLDVVNYRRQQGVDSIAEHSGALAELRDAHVGENVAAGAIRLTQDELAILDALR